MQLKLQHQFKANIH